MIITLYLLIEKILPAIVFSDKYLGCVKTYTFRYSKRSPAARQGNA